MKVKKFKTKKSLIYYIKNNYLKMRILVTGVAGFIGFGVAEKLLENKVNKVYGIDNYDNYYSTKIKKKEFEY